MTIDKNKGITSITYNHLNLPTKVTINGTNNGTIDYIYSADGTKLRKELSTGVTTDYVSGYVYENNVLQFFTHDEGYVSFENGNYEYVYEYKDHLGNVRLSYTDVNGDGDITTNEIIKESNYYPFGLAHKGYNNNVSSLGNSAAKKYMFGGKEYQDELGLGWYDVTARNYDPALGRWMNLDPLAEEMTRHSPYNYAFDNPISFIDPDGMKPFWINNGDGTFTAEANDSASTLHTQFTKDLGLTFEETDAIVESQFEENRVEDGIEKSNIDEGDVVEVGKVTKGDQTIRVVSNDSDLEETVTTEEQFGSTQINEGKKKDIKDFGTIAAALMEVQGGVGKPNLARKILGQTTRKTSVRAFRNNIRTTQSAPTTGTRTVPVKGHWRTTKGGKKVWVKPHTRTIKKPAN